MADKATAQFLHKWFGVGGSGTATTVAAVEVAPSTTESGTFHIFTDGACSDNGKKGARGGFGVHFYSLPTDSQDLSVRLDPSEPQTNNRAELRAIKAAVDWLESHPDYGKRDISIWSDSEYSIHCLTKWASGWQRNGWRKRDGSALQNLDVIRPLFHKLTVMPNVRLRHVEGHQTAKAGQFPWSGNTIADRLATSSLGAKNV